MLLQVVSYNITQHEHTNVPLQVQPELGSQALLQQLQLVHVGGTHASNSLQPLVYPSQLCLQPLCLRIQASDMKTVIEPDGRVL